MLNDTDTIYGMKKNVAAQVISAVLVSATDGSAVTASVSVTVTGDGGVQGAGAGTTTHEGGGEWSYVPTQAETNYDSILFKFSGGGAVPRGMQVYTSFPQTGDNFARIGAPVGASISADIASVKTSVGAVTGAVGSVTGSVGSVAVGGITTTSFGVGAIDAAALATDAVNEVADGGLDRANGIEPGITLRGSQRLILAATAGKLSGAATATVTIRNVGDTKDRITATVDADGNRTAVTTDAT